MSNNPFSELQSYQQPSMPSAPAAPIRPQAPGPSPQRNYVAPPPSATRQQTYGSPLADRPGQWEQPVRSGFQQYMNNKYTPDYRGPDKPNMGDYKRYMANNPQEAYVPQAGPRPSPLLGQVPANSLQRLRDRTAPGDRPAPGSISEMNWQHNYQNNLPLTAGVNTPNYKREVKPGGRDELYVNPYTANGTPVGKELPGGRRDGLVDVRWANRTDYTPGVGGGNNMNPDRVPATRGVHSGAIVNTPAYQRRNTWHDRGNTLYVPPYYADGSPVENPEQLVDSRFADRTHYRTHARRVVKNWNYPR